MSIQELFNEKAKEVKKELGLENTITPPFMSWNTLLKELQYPDISEMDFTHLMKVAKMEGVLFPTRFIIDREEKSVSQAVPPLVISSKEKILNNLFLQNAKKIEEKDRDEMIILYLLSSIYLPWKIARKLEYYPHFQTLQLLEDMLTRGMLVSSLPPPVRFIHLVSSTGYMFGEILQALNHGYFYRKVKEVNRKYFNLLPSPFLRKFSEELNVENLEEYFTSPLLTLKLIEDTANIKLQGSYKGEILTSYKDLLSRKYWEEDILWLYGLKKMEPFYLE